MAAFDTYTDLKATIADFLNRSDLTSAIPAFVCLAEAQMNRRLRCRRMVGRSDAAISANQEYIALPGDFIGPISFSLYDSEETELHFLEAEAFVAERRRFLKGESDGQSYYTVIGEEFRLLRTSPAAVTGELTYWRSVSALSDAAPTNWVLAQFPDLYLYGSLEHSAPYLRDDSRIEMWAQLFAAGVSDTNAADPVPTNKAKRRTDLPLTQYPGRRA